MFFLYFNNWNSLANDFQISLSDLYAQNRNDAEKQREELSKPAPKLIKTVFEEGILNKSLTGLAKTSWRDVVNKDFKIVANITKDKDVVETVKKELKGLVTELNPSQKTVEEWV